MFVWGPVIIALIIGFIIGTRFKNNNIYTLSSFLVIFILAILFAKGIGQFPYYDDYSIATTLIAAAVGLLAGKFIFDR
ncbi:energy-converting hydrogenase B subunit J [Methanobrevibacter sp. DSM 116169]|uniref:energy-converting hydrogenase B subunit J n=1 Tax=Methanobrevibacter sp. DSM 116169 TaxID=3242727 RepID=UPI0038FD35AB